MKLSDLLPWPKKKPPMSGSEAGFSSTQVDELWRRGLTGQGVGIAIIDSGCAPHTLVQDRIVAFRDFLSGQEAQYDDYFHGTALTTIAAGSHRDDFKGVAPLAHVAVLKVMDNQGELEDPELLQALRWVGENRQRYNLQVVNLSLGVNSLEVKREVDKLAEMGVLVCTSAGNSGSRPGSLGVVKGSNAVITVANVDCRGTTDTADDIIDPTSSRVAPGILHGPNVGAPGMDLSIGSTQGGIMPFHQGGTSFATAWASGVMALWKQAMPEITVEQVHQALEASSLALTDTPREAQGSGLIQAARGLDFLLSRKANSSNSTR